MSDDRTLVMTNVRPSSPSLVAFDDGALNELEAAARLVGASGAGSTASPPPVSLGHAGHGRSPGGRPCGEGGMLGKAEPHGAALVAGGVVALMTAATLVFHFLLP